MLKTFGFHVVVVVALLLSFWFAFFRWYMNTVPYLFATHIMESIHFLRFNQKAGAEKREKKQTYTHIDTLDYFRRYMAYLCSLPLDLQALSATFRLQARFSSLQALSFFCRCWIECSWLLAPHIIRQMI